MKQDDHFLQYEGNNWYKRNSEHLSLTEDKPLQLIDLYALQPRRVLEVGASNGYRLAALHERFGSEVHAVEPSEQAIAAGRERYPFIDFQHATAEAMDVEPRSFDLVIVQYVLHWIDRDSLLQSIANIDASLEWGGYLVLGDFQVAPRLKRRYHHIREQEVFTYKQQYRDIFLSTGCYREVALLGYNHDEKSLSGDSTLNTYGAVSLLRKEEDYIICE
jgi:SAM-dependent methyltransferase